MHTKVIAGIPVYQKLKFKQSKYDAGIYVERALNSSWNIYDKAAQGAEEKYIGRILTEDRRVKGSFVVREGAVVGFTDDEGYYSGPAIPVLTSDMMIHADPTKLLPSLLKISYYQYAGKLYYFNGDKVLCLANARYDINKQNTVLYDSIKNKAVALWVG